MPSLVLSSGNVNLASGLFIYSGTGQTIGSVFLYYDKYAVSGPPIHVLAGNLSGNVVTWASGGAMGSGGFADGFPLYAGDTLKINRSRLNSNVSGSLLSVQIGMPAGVSGGRLWWDWDVDRQ